VTDRTIDPYPRDPSPGDPSRGGRPGDGRWEAAGTADDGSWDDDGSWGDDGSWDDEHDDVYLPPESSRVRRALWIVGGAAAAVLVVLVLAGVWTYRQINPGDPGAAVSVTIPVGATVADTAGILEDQGVITSSFVFEYYARWRNLSGVDAGVYPGLRENSSMGDVVDVLEAGPAPLPVTQLVIPEGLWLTDITARILETFPQMDEGELDAALGTVRSRYQPADVTSLEGFLYPATYQVEQGDEADEEKLVRQMVDTFDRTADEIGLGDATERLAGAAGDVTVSPFDALIVASLIEEEARLPEERPQIARVIYNRLAEGMTLGIDASVLYAIGEQKEDITRSELDVDSPYNTRRYAGLPPGPIASPGRSSLEAALAPADGPWLYYVLTDESGAHYFTDDYEDFLAASDDARARGVF
jgi:UPF0755 protein